MWALERTPLDTGMVKLIASVRNKDMLKAGFGNLDRKCVVVVVLVKDATVYWIAREGKI